MVAGGGRGERGGGGGERAAAGGEAGVDKGGGMGGEGRPCGCRRPRGWQDDTLERLVEGRDTVGAHDAPALKRFKFRDGNARMLDLAELLDLVAGRQPILVEIKSEWEAPDRAFLSQIASLAAAYRGPIALMSYDPDVMAVLKGIAPAVPRGIVSGPILEEGHWRGVLDPERAYRLTHLLESRHAAPDFYAYHVGTLPTPVTRFVREVQGVPLFAWTVRTAEERAVAARWADAPIFESYEP